MRPMKGDPVDDLTKVRLPKYGSYKLDGYRAFKFQDQLMSSSFKPIRNQAIQKLFAKVPHGWDGELITGGGINGTFHHTSSVVTSREGGTEGVMFAVFDNFAHTGGYYQRVLSVGVQFRLAHYELKTLAQVEAFEATALSLQYEGIMLREPLGPYKHGYATLTEQWLLKVKRFADAEGVVTGIEEMYSNQNEAKIDAQGFTERSSHKAGMVPTGLMGNLVLDYKGQVIKLGQGFTLEQRKQMFDNPPLGELAKFKYPPGGKPVSEGGTGLRPPYVFLGIRHKDDL